MAYTVWLVILLSILPAAETSVPQAVPFLAIEQLAIPDPLQVMVEEAPDRTREGFAEIDTDT